MSAVSILYLPLNHVLTKARFSSELAMYWPSKPWRGKELTSMNLLGRGGWPCTADVGSRLAFRRLMLTTAVVFGPAATKWYQFLQKKINLSTNVRTTAARVLADQTLFASTNMAVFLSSMSILEGSSPQEKLKKNYLSGLKANWIVWPPVQSFNFTVVPLEHRVLVVNIVSLGWNCFLSYLNSSK
jgi:protein Mpv17